MQNGQVKRGALRTKLVVLAILIIALVAGSVIYKNYRYRAAHSPEATGNSFVAAITNKDGSTSYNLFTDKAKKQLTADDWNSWVVFTFDTYDGGKPKFIKKESVPDPGHNYSSSDTVERLRYQFTFNDKTYTYDVILAPAGDSWKIAEVGGLQ